MARGAAMHRLEVDDVHGWNHGAVVHPRRGDPLTADAAVIATGDRLSRLAGRWLRVPVQAQSGYSFTVPVDRPILAPIYLPDIRVACTPYKGALRVSGALNSADATRRTHASGWRPSPPTPVPYSTGWIGPRAAMSGPVLARSPRWPPAHR